MCGIAAIVGPRAEAMTREIAVMSAALAHRGPDSSGVFTAPGVALGFRRLSIQDLAPAADQPFASASGRYQLIFNGEIYNFRELRETLGGAYRTTGDTEVLMAAWERWGMGCLERLNGMFAFAIWDVRERCLTVVRDRFGIKPLFIAEYKGHLLFASEIKALFAAGVTSEPNHETISDYLMAGVLDHRPETFFRHIRRVEPGCTITVSAEGEILDERRYYDLALHTAEPLDIGFEEAREQYLAALKKSLAQHLIADVEVGFSVSGGVDSSAMLSLAVPLAEASSQQRIYSMDFDDTRYSERPWVEQLVRKFELPCEFVMVREQEIVDALPSMVRAQDEPFGGLPTVAWSLFYKHCNNRGTKVIIDGNGADESLAGYRPDATLRLAQLSKRSDRSAFEKEAKAYMSFWGIDEAVLDKALKAELNAEGGALAIDGTSPVAPEAVRQEIAELSGGNAGSLIEGMPGDLRGRSLERLGATKLPRALRFSDRNSMAFSIELRVPFLDHELVEMSLRMPDAHKVRGGCGKFLLREALRDSVPEAVRKAPKRSVQTPQREWLRRGPLSDMLRETLDNPGSLLAEVLDIDKARKLFQRHVEVGAKNSNYLWQWLNLDLWHRMVVKQPQPNNVLKWPSPRIETYSGTQHQPDLV